MAIFNGFRVIRGCDRSAHLEKLAKIRTVLVLACRKGPCVGGDGLFRAQDEPHVPNSGDIGHLNFDDLGAKLAQSVNGSFYGVALLRMPSG